MKSKAVYGAILLVMYLLYLLYVVKEEVKTYDTMNVDERIRTEQSIAPGW